MKFTGRRKATSEAKEEKEEKLNDMKGKEK